MSAPENNAPIPGAADYAITMIGQGREEGAAIVEAAHRYSASSEVVRSAVRARLQGAEPTRPEEQDEPEYDPGQRGPCQGHSWVFSGTAYGGDDESFHGEGRAYCEHCGADGDA